MTKDQYIETLEELLKENDIGFYSKDERNSGKFPHLHLDMVEEGETYNGWTNYATWRVNLEMVDSVHYEESGVTYNSISDLADAIKNDCELYLGDESGGYGGKWLNHDYAMAFLKDVNWHEIAENIAEEYPKLIN